MPHVQLTNPHRQECLCYVQLCDRRGFAATDYFAGLNNFQVGIFRGALAD
jgi:hypothetical protein